MATSPQTDERLDRLVARLEGEEGCRVIILYGSRARGDAGPNSDYDLIAFRDGERPPARETGVRNGALLDVFIYPTDRLAEPSVDMLHVRGGRALRDHDGQGAAFLARLDEIFDAGPKPLRADEAEALRNWAWKMLDRAAQGDIEAHFRRVFLLTMQLENFFLLRNEWYLGPKAALSLLRADHPAVCAALERALRPSASLVEIEALVVAVNGPRP
jgi:predicted nucleotidyltransferase